MRKIATLLIAVLTLVSCGDEVEFSTPALQGNKNYELWRAEFFNAALDVDGQLTITGGNNIEEISFVLPSANVGTYLLSDTSAGRADFVDFNGVGYSTANTPDPSVTLYPEIGEVEITESVAGYVTGTFRFIAFTADGLQSVGFNEGIFYRVPFAGGNGSGNNANCQDATQDLALAAAAFSEVSEGDPEYTTRCNAYKAALEDVIDACGDEEGTWQAIIDALGDCS
jgi:hypothetical protein